jgi:hypothetical protein
LSPPAESPVLFRDSAELPPSESPQFYRGTPTGEKSGAKSVNKFIYKKNNKMIMENKKQSFKRIMVKRKIRTSGFLKKTPALAKISGDGEQRNPDPEQ